MSEDQEKALEKIKSRLVIRTDKTPVNDQSAVSFIAGPFNRQQVEALAPEVKKSNTRNLKDVEESAKLTDRKKPVALQERDQGIIALKLQMKELIRERLKERDIIRMNERHDKEVKKASRSFDYV